MLVSCFSHLFTTEHDKRSIVTLNSWHELIMTYFARTTWRFHDTFKIKRNASPRRVNFGYFDKQTKISITPYDIMEQQKTRNNQNNLFECYSHCINWLWMHRIWITKTKFEGLSISRDSKRKKEMIFLNIIQAYKTYDTERYFYHFLLRWRGLRNQLVSIPNCILSTL